MPTKLARLRTTLLHVDALWKYECKAAVKNAVNEGAWSLQVIEPILAALDWPRLSKSQKTNGTGACFEWPGKHAVDIVLLESGVPRGFFELKVGTKEKPTKLAKQLQLHPKLKQAHVAVAAWSNNGEAFFCPYQILPDGDLVEGNLFRISDAISDARLLGQFAAPALMRHTSDVCMWLNSTEPDPGPIRPRYRPREIQQWFFELLQTELHLSARLELRYRNTAHEPPSPTYAFAELPGVLPAGCGIVFDADNTMNQLQCFFYRDGSGIRLRKPCTTKWCFDETGMSNQVIDEFVKAEVLPAIKRFCEALK